MCVCVVKMQRLASQLVKFRARSSPVAQWVKDLASSLQQFWLLLWHRFDPWLGSIHMLQVQEKKKKIIYLNTFSHIPIFMIFELLVFLDE